MNDLIRDEQTPLDGGDVSLPNALTREEGEISESEDELDANDIRNARTMITTDLDIREPLRVVPARLTFILPEPLGNLSPEEDPKPRATRSLDRYEHFLGTADTPATADLGNEAGQTAADLLRNSLGPPEEGSALHGTIKSALWFHEAWLKHNQKKHHSWGGGPRAHTLGYLMRSFAISKLPLSPVTTRITIRLR